MVDLFIFLLLVPIIMGAFGMIKRELDASKNKQLSHRI